MSAHNDFARMTDGALEKFIVDNPGHAYFGAASFEYQRRQSAKNQRLTRWAILFAAVSVAVGVVFGVIQCHANKPPATPTTASPREQPLGKTR
jgi:hypothetical protein